MTWAGWAGLGWAGLAGLGWAGGAVVTCSGQMCDATTTTTTSQTAEWAAALLHQAVLSEEWRYTNTASILTTDILHSNH